MEDSKIHKFSQLGYNIFDNFPLGKAGISELLNLLHNLNFQNFPQTSTISKYSMMCRINSQGRIEHKCIRINHNTFLVGKNQQVAL